LLTCFFTLRKIIIIVNKKLMHTYYKIERESYAFTKPKRVVNKLIFNVVDKYDNVTSVSRCIMIFLIEKCKKHC
jgi:hypothetical protein